MKEYVLYRVRVDKNNSENHSSDGIILNKAIYEQIKDDAFIKTKNSFGLNEDEEYSSVVVIEGLKNILDYGHKYICNLDFPEDILNSEFNEENSELCDKIINDHNKIKDNCKIITKK